ncbi:hypothetical protein [Gordonia sihwensis]|uniref:hypothetical protein n=1 Tax=Gordonia sihwensis TaxID=173559 RepID=UPI002416EE9C|nr:hypothetical protein [Gordonia sihwensis]WFN93446.1 hypothetical protein P5P27_02410 [Gordonia sihwensis]
MSNLMVARDADRRRPGPVRNDADPKPMTGQPTWCRRITAAHAQLPSGLDPDGNRTIIPAGQPIRLVHAGFDSLGRDVWTIPADQWWPGDTVIVGPIPSGVIIRRETHREETAA